MEMVIYILKREWMISLLFDGCQMNINIFDMAY